MATHHFQPTHYHRAIGSHEPVLRIAPGDTVITTTVDAGGGDAGGNRVTPGGNPQTGPFYVDGAKPGDTLEVTFDRLWPNREEGFYTFNGAGTIEPLIAGVVPHCVASPPGFEPGFQP